MATIEERYISLLTGHGDRYIGSLFRGDEPVPDDSGNGLLDYALCTEDGTEELWNSNDGYDVLIVGENCELEL